MATMRRRPIARDWDDVMADAMDAAGITALPCKRCDDCGVLFDAVRPCDCDTPDISEMTERAFEADVNDAECAKADAAYDRYWEDRYDAEKNGDYDRV